MPCIPAEERIGTVIRGNFGVIAVIRDDTKWRNNVKLELTCLHCPEHTIVIRNLGDIVSGKTSSCGCKGKKGVSKGCKKVPPEESLHKHYPGGEVLEILGLKQYKDHKYTMVKVRCPHCLQHTEYEARLDNIRSGNTKSCGCIKDGYEGEVLSSGCVLIKQLGKKHERAVTTWIVRCHCDEHTLFETTIDSLRKKGRGGTSSCGCNTGNVYNGYVNSYGKILKCHSMSEVYMMNHLEVDEGYHVLRPRLALWTPLGKYTPDIYIEETGQFIEVKGPHLKKIYSAKQQEDQEAKRIWLREHRGIVIPVLDSKEIDKLYGF